MRALEEILEELRSAMREQRMRSLLVYSEISSGPTPASKQHLEKIILRALGKFELSVGASLSNAVRDIWPPNSGKWPTNHEIDAGRVGMAEQGLLTVNSKFQLSTGPKVELTQLGWDLYHYSEKIDKGLKEEG
jgi:hypothetical protein